MSEVTQQPGGKAKTSTCDPDFRAMEPDCCCCCHQITSVVSDSVRPHRQQPTRLPSPWDSPGKNTGVGCHFLLQCVKVKSESEVTQSCLTLSDPMDCSPPGLSIHHGIFQARVLEWGAIAFCDGTLQWPPSLHSSGIPISLPAVGLLFSW